eukprot:COSAG01_NODE_3955_length_5495_cov_215.437280_4_plen_226_part_00
MPACSDVGHQLIQNENAWAGVRAAHLSKAGFTSASQLQAAWTVHRWRHSWLSQQKVVAFVPPTDRQVKHAARRGEKIFEDREIAALLAESKTNGFTSHTVRVTATVWGGVAVAAAQVLAAGDAGTSPPALHVFGQLAASQGDGGRLLHGGATVGASYVGSRPRHRPAWQQQQQQQPLLLFNLARLNPPRHSGRKKTRREAAAALASIVNRSSHEVEMMALVLLGR